MLENSYQEIEYTVYWKVFLQTSTPSRPPPVIHYSSIGHVHSLKRVGNAINSSYELYKPIPLIGKMVFKKILLDGLALSLCNL